MKFRVDEITSVIEEEIRKYRTDVDLSEVGRVLEVGDGIARIYGLTRRHGRRAPRIRERRAGPGVQPGRELGRRRHPRRLPGHQGGGRGPPHRRAALRPLRPGDDRPRGRPARPAAGRQGRHRDAVPPAAGVQGPRHRRAAAGERAAADRHQGHRQHDPDRPRPARADHRRPQDRQDRRRDRHHHQPEGRRRDLRLRRHRPEGVDRRRPRGKAPRERRHGLHHRHLGLGGGPGAAAVHRPLRGRGHGRVLHVPGRAGDAVRLRRPVEAGAGLPPALAAAAPAAGPRGVPRRRVLPPLAPAGAQREAARRVRGGAEGHAGRQPRPLAGGQASAGAGSSGRAPSGRPPRPLPPAARPATRPRPGWRPSRTPTSTRSTASRTAAAR